MISCSSGRRYFYNPRYYIGDHENQIVIDGDGDIIYTNEKAFSEMVCMPKSTYEQLTIRLKMGLHGSEDE